MLPLRCGKRASRSTATRQVVWTGSGPSAHVDGPATPASVGSCSGAPTARIHATQARQRSSLAPAAPPPFVHSKRTPPGSALDARPGRESRSWRRGFEGVLRFAGLRSLGGPGDGVLRGDQCERNPGQLSDAQKHGVEPNRFRRCAHLAGVESIARWSQFAAQRAGISGTSGGHARRRPAASAPSGDVCGRGTRAIGSRCRTG